MDNSEHYEDKPKNINRTAAENAAREIVDLLLKQMGVKPAQVATLGEWLKVEQRVADIIERSCGMDIDRQIKALKHYHAAKLSHPTYRFCLCELAVIIKDIERSYRETELAKKDKE